MSNRGRDDQGISNFQETLDAIAAIHEVVRTAKEPLTVVVVDLAGNGRAFARALGREPDAAATSTRMWGPREAVAKAVVGYLAEHPRPTEGTLDFEGHALVVVSDRHATLMPYPHDVAEFQSLLAKITMRGGDS